MQNGSLSVRKDKQNGVLRLQQTDGKFVDLMLEPYQCKSLGDQLTTIYHSIMLEQMGAIEPAVVIGDNGTGEERTSIQIDSAPDGEETPARV